MTFAISKLPVTAQYKLEVDPSGEAYVEFRQARRGDDERRDNRLDDTVYLYTEGKLSGVRRGSTILDVVRLEVFMTLWGSNLVWEDEDEKQSPVFKFKKAGGLAMSEDEFRKVWDMLPTELGAEIVRHCHTHNPHWGPAGLGED